MSLQHLHTKGSYQVRNWEVADLSFDQTVPAADEIPMRNIYGMESSMGDRLKDDARVFFYDIEQMYAGLDTVYGVSSVRVLSEDFTLPSGTTATAGSLVVDLTKVDIENKTMGYLFEV